MSNALDFAKVDALRAHMLLTVDSMTTLLGVSRVSYYNWLKGAKMRDTTQAKIRKVTRSLVALVSNQTWPNDAVFVAKQPERLKMLQDILKELDNQPVQ